ncbi:acyl carrier protein [Chromobacterium sp. IIBBL 290-4]|uniref:acyl carrier protein n=1 Tax=Chromobacterium sp. IIBBL 290-4 TaxID=2953890 RepID=UPI0020B6FE87|nr:phosphopantetheine-binding protein [Chromobacterium sp. IIBBL 290-4]UTH76439.1 phosphopantetheine-binding protein [Chromobacterium sp. IIBBL 290-4]
MNENHALDVVTGLILELNIPGLDMVAIQPHASLQSDLGIDSLNRLILLVRLQERAGIELARVSRDATEFKSVGDLTSFMLQHA